MAKTKLLPVKELAIDLRNFRTVRQKTELDAIKAMISISPDYFWGLMESLLDDGYLPTENILVLQDAKGVNQVKEGNRRIASLKIILSLVNTSQLNLPPKITEQISQLPASWLKENSKVPCAVYDPTEKEIVDKIVTNTHGKGQKAGRDPWEAVARARHNKIVNKASEPGLELLEKYLDHGSNLTQDQKTRWAGRYHLTVLDEAIKKTASRFGVSSSPELAKQYPTISHKIPLDEIIHAIGLESLTFPAIRDSSDFASRFGLPPLGQSAVPSTAAGTSPGNSSGISGTTAAGSPGKQSNPGNANPASQPAGGNSTGSTGNSTGSNSTSTGSSAGKTSATATTDERSVKKSLRALKLFGTNRSKIETLRKEILKLKLKDNPIAFCFLLRSIFEISAKAYCQDNKGKPAAPTATKPDGSDKTLADVLREIVNYLTQNKTDKSMVKLLHGPLTEIQRPDGILSITSMNQLVHSTTFTIHWADIPTLFSNIFPLLDQMNK
ncbi:hypothetical protein J2W30_005655 [Variovorax boronicumulans]|uniref:hypothetical protein n=1 Tax=Variovorax boronicumulans TaxID=436515 RepID=UPI0027888084|nr:hypothetical protein [Variovorax boronicumulans]MDQ0037876.1 hypothetical protein [Variovorax boronicumulans]